ncbi:hypothetical protein HJFPF1_04194 [Paramyrothecium foliicola]|nr:hypothetical protein HJFPF1_04194 [Paramyrothecium foliicola]
MSKSALSQNTPVEESPLETMIDLRNSTRSSEQQEPRSGGEHQGRVMQGLCTMGFLHLQHLIPATGGHNLSLMGGLPRISGR